MSEKVVIGRRYSEIGARINQILETGEQPEPKECITPVRIPCYCGCHPGISIKPFEAVYRVFPEVPGSMEVIKADCVESYKSVPKSF
jgi:hypothetical protein